MCVEECPSITGDTICLYDNNIHNNGTELVGFCYTTLSAESYGKFCYPD